MVSRTSDDIRLEKREGCWDKVMVRETDWIFLRLSVNVVDRDTAAQTKHPCFVFAHSYIIVRVLLDVEGKPKKYHNMFKEPPPHPGNPPLIFFVPYIWVLLNLHTLISPT